MSLSEIDKGIQAIAREEHEKQKQQLLGELDRIVKQNRVSIDTKPNSSETSAIVYYVPEDNSQKVTLELYALKNHKELLDRVIEVKKTSSSRLLLGILLI
jgi:aspartokinase